jgi:hypothetical protein
MKENELQIEKRVEYEQRTNGLNWIEYLISNYDNIFIYIR